MEKIAPADNSPADDIVKNALATLQNAVNSFRPPGRFNQRGVGGLINNLRIRLNWRRRSFGRMSPSEECWRIAADIDMLLREAEYCARQGEHEEAKRALREAFRLAGHIERLTDQLAEVDQA